MAVLTRAKQGNHPVSAPNILGHRGHGGGWMDRNVPTCPSSHNGQTRVGTVPQGKGSTQRSKDGQGNVQSTKDPSSLQCFRCQGWGHMARECATPPKTLNKDRGTEGMQPNPCQQQSTISTQHSLPDPKPKSTQMKAAKKRGSLEVTPVPFLNPNLIACLGGTPMRPQ